MAIVFNATTRVSAMAIVFNATTRVSAMAMCLTIVFNDKS